MSISIISQPTANSLKAAYRPIIISGSVSPFAPVVFCDVYFSDIFYKTLSVSSPGTNFQFDIQDAIQEYLKKFIAPNGNSNIAAAASLFVTVTCKLRGSSVDVNGFTIIEGTVPIQATGSSSAVAGDGTSTNSFYALCSSLQHEDNQDLASHLNSYKTGTWGATTWPLTHRLLGYKQSASAGPPFIGGSDYLPIFSLVEPSCVRLIYNGGAVSDCGVFPGCPMVTGIDIEAFDNGDGTQTISVFWDAPDQSLSTIDVQYRINGSASAYTSHIVLALAGNTSVVVPLGTYDVRLKASGACNPTTTDPEVVGVDPPECVPIAFVGSPSIGNATVGIAYDQNIVITGDLPYDISAVTKPAWMTITPGPTTELTGIPGPGDAGTGITVAFTLSNACGSIDFSQEIDVDGGVHFIETTFVSGDSLNDAEIANLLGIPGSTAVIQLTTLNNPNGGVLKVNGSPAFAGNNWNVFLDGLGEGTLDVEINGIVNPGTVMIGTFNIIGVDFGGIGSPDIYQISKVFT